VSGRAFLVCPPCPWLVSSSVCPCTRRSALAHSVLLPQHAPPAPMTATLNAVARLEWKARAPVGTATEKTAKRKEKQTHLVSSGSAAEQINGRGREQREAEPAGSARARSVFASSRVFLFLTLDGSHCGTMRQRKEQSTEQQQRRSRGTTGARTQRRAKGETAHQSDARQKKHSLHALGAHAIKREME
jgi:hypothetical protein